MDISSAKTELKTLEPDFLLPAKKKINGSPTYICPVCGNGSGRKGDGIALCPDNSHGKKWKCFTCGLCEDIIGLWELYTGNSDHGQAFRDLYARYGIQTDSPSFDGADNRNDHQNNTDTFRPDTCIDSSGSISIIPPDGFGGFYSKAHESLEATDYWKRRGISRETADKFCLGFVPGWTHPKAPKAEPSPRLIIPVTAHSYLARDTRDEIPPDQEPYKKSKVKGAERVGWIFNSNALSDSDKPVFIVEGELDALSLIEAGAEAAALGSVANINAFIELVKVSRPSQPLLIALDNEKEPDKRARILQAAESLENGLNALGIPCYRLEPAEVYGRFKDANEALVQNREMFTAAVGAVYSDIARKQDEAAEQVRTEYMKHSTAHCLQDFLNGIAASVDTPYISTGFSRLDDMLDGGLYEGLYFCGAISSLGKTTFALQICDCIAQQGYDVLIFSLEMAKNELISKSISRHTLTDVLQKGGDIKNAKTARGITCGARYAHYSAAEKELIQRSVIEYSKYAEHIFVFEGVGDMGTEQIRDAVERHIAVTGQKPVVLVDYVQILAPADVMASDKQNTDKAVLELKRISRDHKLPVIAVSSLNRENYKGKINMAAFKESGAIEYGSDVLIGLQLKGAEQKDFDADKAKSRDPREIELVILKNRNGRTGGKSELEYYPMFNFFREV